MKIIHGYDSDGLFKADFILRTVDLLDSDGNIIDTQDIPDDPDGIAACAGTTETPVPQGLQCPQWTGSQWIDAGIPWQRDSATGDFIFEDD